MQIPIFRGGGCMKKVKLGQLVSIQTGKLDANAAVFGGKYPFFTTAKEISRINEYAYDGEVVLVAGNGDLNVKYYKGKFNAYQRTYILTSNSNVRMKYLYYFLDKYIEVLRYQSIGGVIKYIKLNNLSDAQIPMRSIFEQDKIIGILEKLDNEIIIRSKQLSELSNLVKSRFNEMFGSKKFDKVSISELVDDRIVIAKKKFDQHDTIKYIDISSIDNKNYKMTGFQEYMLNQAPSRAQQHIRKGDIVVSTVRPNLKNIAITELDDENLVASSGFCVLRALKCLPEYLFAIICSDRFTNKMTNIVTGANYPAIKSSDIMNYIVPLPPIQLQNEFADFVAQVDKSQFACQMAIKLWRISLKSSII